jgi:glutamine amidotransferase
MTNIVIIDYGCGNLKSTLRAFQIFDKKILISSDPSIIVNADKIVFPGVGSFGFGMSSLKKLDLISPIMEFLKKGNPFLGICLGMQILFNKSSEHGNHKGLCLLPGTIDLISGTNILTGKIRKVPHVGWNLLKMKKNKLTLNNTCLNNLGENSYVYFTHSYQANIENREIILAQVDYDGCLINSVVQKDNIIGIQFHPEKSGPVGLKIIENFVNF